MSRHTKTRFGVITILGVGFVLGYIVACSNTQPAKSTSAEEAEKAIQPDATQEGKSKRPSLRHHRP